ncbi:uncharacterized protein LOC133491257 isoform X2 [Syngnathoides biaculeatus]|uniref:uncharacterized protein LOC133491257 isoform X2 n=1 Tax=Syngnathoides biaculeatus TaxID=300417 RepID=UPI002ADE27E1|nr:uncharacterized protein LOC133491257 isoform X2 [Syngnathoides biaculeatus]
MTVFRRLCVLVDHRQLLLLLFLTAGILDPCSSLGQIHSARCRPDKYLTKYEHCQLASPGGVAGLECFGKYRHPSTKRCQWRRGADEREEANVTLVILQRTAKYCRMYKSTKETSTDVEVYTSHNLTVEVLEQVGSKCSKDAFTAHPSSLLRCGPPLHATFRRHSGSRVDVGARWSVDDAEVVGSVCVRRREAGDRHRRGDGPWRRTCCRGASGCHLAGAVAPSPLEVQLACEVSDKCSECPWGPIYTLPPELTKPPLNLHAVEDKMADARGRRRISLTWTFSEECDGFRVSVGKASGEPPLEVLDVTRPPVALLLSGSDFRVHVEAFNNVSASPAAGVALTAPRVADDDGGHAKLRVSVHNRTSFSVFWQDDLVSEYSCFSLEWRATDGSRPPNASYESFYENANNFWTLVDIPEPLRPYTGYVVRLHVRDRHPPCNLKRVNNSQEATYATARFYFLEGSPVSAPANVSMAPVTSSSAEVSWSPVRREDRRGFLLGYVIYYAEDRQPEKNVSVGRQVRSYILEGLRSGAVYQIQVSGLTRVGPGVRSAPTLLETRREGFFDLTALLIASTLVVLAAMLASLLFKRAKAVFWPTIPNPAKSRSMQKLNGPTQLLLQTTLKLEECDRASLLVVEPRAPPSVRRSAAVDDEPGVATSRGPPAAPSGGYTSLDVIQQMMMMMTTATTTHAGDYKTQISVERDARVRLMDMENAHLS